MEVENKIATGFFISVASVFVGLTVRLSVKELSTTRFNLGIEWPIEKQNAWAEIGLSLIVFGLVLFVVVFNQWLNHKPTSQP